MLEKQIPVAGDNTGAQVRFAWQDAFTQRTTRLCSMQFEKCAVMFNIGAASASMALNTDRTTPAGAGQAAKLYQEAAGCWVFLRDQVGTPTESSSDMCTQALGLLEKVALALAQVCVFEKAAMEGKLAGTMSKLAQQVSEMLKEVHEAMWDKSNLQITGGPGRSWRDWAQAHHLFFAAEAQRQAALVHAGEPSSQMGLQIGRLQQAQEHLRELGGALRRMQGSKLAERSKAMQDQISEALNRAVKDNSIVYLQVVPKAGDLPPLTPFKVVSARQPKDEGSEQQDVWFGELMVDQRKNVLEQVGTVLVKLGSFLPK